MKSSIYKLVLGIFALFLVSFSSYAVTYNTLNNGNWNDVVNVWSTDGVTPCGCTPGATSAGNDIIINHAITLNYNLLFNAGSVFTLNASGSITNNKNIIVNSATADFFGNGSINKLNTEIGANVTFHSGAVLNSGAITLDDGVITLDNAIIYSGSVNINPLGTLNITNSSRLHMVTGNFDVSGILNIGFDSCLSSNGNISVSASGSIFGAGAISSGGGMNNSGFVDLTIAWCANGGDSGMPTPENCAAADGICGAIPLPVELVFFEGKVVNDDYASLMWVTATETNNAYFSVLKSTTGSDWREIDRIDGAGNSQKAITYVSNDLNLATGTTYYRLIQVDFDGKGHYSEVIAVNKKESENPIILFPNPVSSSDLLNVKNVQEKDVILIRNSSGTTAIEHHTDSETGSTQIDISSLTPGMYFVNTANSDRSETVKLVVTP